MQSCVVCFQRVFMHDNYVMCEMNPTHVMHLNCQNSFRNMNNIQCPYCQHTDKSTTKQQEDSILRNIRPFFTTLELELDHLNQVKQRLVNDNTAINNLLLTQNSTYDANTAELRDLEVATRQTFPQLRQVFGTGTMIVNRYKKLCRTLCEIDAMEHTIQTLLEYKHTLDQTDHKDDVRNKADREYARVQKKFQLFFSDDRNITYFQHIHDAHKQYTMHLNESNQGHDVFIPWEFVTLPKTQ